MAINLKICEDKEEWENILDRCHRGTVFHKWDFLKVMEKHSHISFLGKHKARLYPIIGFEKGRPIGLFPIFYYEAPLLRAVFSPAQRSAATYMGPVIVSEEEKVQSRQEALGFEFVGKVDEFMISHLKANIIKIRTPPNILDSRYFIWNNYETTPMYNYEIDLSKGLDYVFGGFEDDLQKSIKKTTSKGFHSEEGNEEDFNVLISDVFKRYAEQGLDPESDKEYFFDVFRLLYPGNLKVFIVKQGSEYQTGSICLHYKERVVAWVGSPKTSLKGVYPNDLLKWGCIQWAANNNHKSFEITWANSQKLCNYKSKFNPETKIYFSCEKYSRLASLLISLRRIFSIKGILYPKR